VARCRHSLTREIRARILTHDFAILLRMTMFYAGDDRPYLCPLIPNSTRIFLRRDVVSTNSVLSEIWSAAPTSHRARTVLFLMRLRIADTGHQTEWRCAKMSGKAETLCGMRLTCNCGDWAKAQSAQSAGLCAEIAHCDVWHSSGFQGRPSEAAQAAPTPPGPI